MGIAAWLGPPVLGELRISGSDNSPIDSKSAAAYSFLGQSPQLVNSRPNLILVHLSEGPLSDGTRRRISRVVSVTRSTPNVGEVISFLGSGAAAESADARKGQQSTLNFWQQQFFSKDRKWGVVAVLEKEGLPPNVRAVAVEDLHEHLAKLRGVQLGGWGAISAEIRSKIRDDLRQAELISFPAILLLLFLWFRKGLLAILPLLAGAATLCETLLLIRLLHGLVFDFSLLAIAPVAGLALGLSVDYALLLVGRYREEMKRNPHSLSALDSSVRKVAPTVLASALTMMFSLAPLALFKIPLLTSLSTAAGYCAIVAAFNALTIVPAILAIYGERIRTPGRPGSLRRSIEPRTPWYWSHAPRYAIRHPWRTIISVSALLLLIAAPIVTVRVMSQSENAILGDSEANNVTQLVQRQFDNSVGAERYTVLVTAPPAARSALGKITEDIQALPGVEEALGPTSLATNVWKIEAQGESAIGTDVSRRAVSEIEGVASRYSPYVASPSAVLVDRDRALAHHLPAALALVATIVFVILFLFTDSFVLPVKMLLLTVLALMVSLGAVVVLSPVIGGGTGGGFDSAQLVILTVISVALITDYGVFVVARIIERHKVGMGDEQAIAEGTLMTGPVVSMAASIFCVAVGAFVISDINLIKQLCLGMVLAVLIDTTIVRALLVPALMSVLGRFNWWAPKWASAFRRWLLT
jgi:RND superfamily putative drug exporter